MLYNLCNIVFFVEYNIYLVPLASLPPEEGSQLVQNQFQQLLLSKAVFPSASLSRSCLGCVLALASAPAVCSTQSESSKSSGESVSNIQCGAPLPEKGVVRPLQRQLTQPVGDLWLRQGSLAQTDYRTKVQDFKTKHDFFFLFLFLFKEQLQYVFLKREEGCQSSWHFTMSVTPRLSHGMHPRQRRQLLVKLQGSQRLKK